MTDDLLTTGEAARLLHVDRRTIIRWVERGLISGFRTIGGRYRVQRVDLLAAIARATAEATR